MKRKTSFITGCLFIFLFSSAAWGTVYYIDPAGSDSTGDGSSGNPWYELSYACSQVTTPGDIIHINPGTFTDTGYCELAVGVGIEGAGMSSVTINVSAGHPLWGFYISAVSTSETTGNHIIHDFTVDGGDTPALGGIRTRERHGIEVFNMRIQDFNNGGIRIEGEPDTMSAVEPAYYAQGVTIHDNILTNCTSGEMIGALLLESLEGAVIYNNTIDEFDGNGRGMKLCQYGWYKDVDIRGNTVSTYAGDGNAFVIEMYNFCDESLIRDNTFNGPLSLNGGLTTRIAGSTWNLQIDNNIFDMAAWTSETFIELSHHWLDFSNNYIEGNDTYVRGAGIWTTNYSTSSSVNHVRIRNNIVYNTAETSLYISKNAVSYDDIQIFNNVVDTVNTVSWGGFGISVIGNSTVTNLNVRNNVVLNAENRWLYVQVGVSGAVFTNNYHFGNGDGDNHYNIGSGNIIANNTTSNPEIYRAGNIPDPYYRPSSADANIVDDGIDVGLPYTGTAPDVGAYEYESTALEPPAAPTGLRFR